jgi:hypothetical protein
MATGLVILNLSFVNPDPFRPLGLGVFAVGEQDSPSARTRCEASRRRGSDQPVSGRMNGSKFSFNERI